MNSGIYKITNNITKKSYIGQSKNLAGRKKIFYDFSKKYAGKKINLARMDYPSASNWDYEVLEYSNDQNELNELEIYYIYKFNTMLDGYNTSPGGHNSDYLSSQQYKMWRQIYKNLAIIKKYNKENND